MLLLQPEQFESVYAPPDADRDTVDHAFSSEEARRMESWIDQELAGCDLPDARRGK
jgi:hypothetical protein